MPILSRGIMLEGISCSGKTSTMYAIKRLFATDTNLERNIVMLGEHYTQVLNSVNGELINHEHSEHTEMLYKRLEMIEQLNRWACSLGEFNRRSRGLYTVFERGLINHIAHYEDYDNPLIIELGQRLADLGIEAIMLTISDDLLEKRIRQRDVQMNRTQSESSYRELVYQAKILQDKMLNVLAKTNLPARIINTDSMNWDEYANRIIRI